MSRKGLARLATLYEQVERVRLAEWRQAAAAVGEAERLRVAAVTAGELYRSEGRALLSRGEAMEWRVAESSLEMAEVEAARAEELRVKLDVAQAGANDIYRLSRMQTERVARVVEGLAAGERELEQKREQAAADDRFGARLCWTRMKAG